MLSGRYGWAPFSGCQTVQRFARQAKRSPLVHGHGSELLIKLHGLLVPIKYGPFQPPAAAFAAEAREREQKRFANSPAAKLMLHEKVLDENAGFAHEARKRKGIDSEPRRLTSDISENGFGYGTLAKKRSAHVRFRDGRLAGNISVFRQFADELEHQWRV